MTTLCIDFGNTRLKAAVFHDHFFIEEINIESDSIETISSLLEKYNPAKTILSSVINHNPEIEILLASKTLFHKLSNQSKLNFHITVSKPDSIGADRLALIAAACNIYPNKNNLIIGLGSCITYNFVNQQHLFIGGAISPGMDLRFKSMHDYTAKLPLVQSDPNFPFIGYDTKTNLQSGVIFGIASEIDGFIEKYSNKYGNFNVVLTGGDAPYFASQLKNKIFADIYFLFKGLYALSELNN
ncbi:MAG: type III pantothenate kinase [Bacteroidota bacterium]